MPLTLALARRIQKLCVAYGYGHAGYMNPVFVRVFHMVREWIAAGESEDRAFDKAREWLENEKNGPDGIAEAIRLRSENAIKPKEGTSG